MVNLSIIVFFLGLCSATLVHSDASEERLVLDLSIVILESELNNKTNAVQTYLDGLTKSDTFYDNQKIVDQIDETKEVFYGLLHKIKHAIHHAVDQVKKGVENIVKSVAKPIEDAVHQLTNQVKNVVHDATHLRETIVKRVKDLENQVKSAVQAIKSIPKMVIGELKNELADAKNILKDTLTLHINQVKEDIAGIVTKLKTTLTAVLKAELENAKKMLEGDLKAALEAWAIAYLGPFGAALEELITLKQTIDNYKNMLLDKLNLALQLKDKITAALKLDIFQHIQIVRDQFNKFIGQLHAKIDVALRNALVLVGVPVQVQARIENAIQMVGQGLTQARNRILDLEQQIQLATGDIKTKVIGELNDFLKQHGDVLRKTEQQLLALKAQVDAKVATVQGALKTVLAEMQSRIDARIDELKKFEQQMVAKIGKY